MRNQLKNYGKMFRNQEKLGGANEKGYYKRLGYAWWRCWKLSAILIPSDFLAIGHSIFNLFSEDIFSKVILFLNSFNLDALDFFI